MDIEDGEVLSPPDVRGVLTEAHTLLFLELQGQNRSGWFVRV